MKTALRTYHPVPSLQKTDGNAQDAPRIKNCLKAAQLPSELKTVPPSTPEDVLEKVVSPFTAPLKLNERPIIVNFKKAGQRPPTTVVNLVFVLANHAAVRD
jgi:Ino eighty subunit 1